VLEIVTELRRVQERLRDPNDNVRLNMSEIGVSADRCSACIAGFIFLNNPEVFKDEFGVSKPILKHFYGIDHVDTPMPSDMLPLPLNRLFFDVPKSKEEAISSIERCIEELQAA